MRFHLNFPKEILVITHRLNLHWMSSSFGSFVDLSASQVVMDFKKVLNLYIDIFEICCLLNNVPLRNIIQFPKSVLIRLSFENNLIQVMLFAS